VSRVSPVSLSDVLRRFRRRPVWMGSTALDSRLRSSSVPSHQNSSSRTSAVPALGRKTTPRFQGPGCCNSLHALLRILDLRQPSSALQDRAQHVPHQFVKPAPAAIRVERDPRVETGFHTSGRCVSTSTSVMPSDQTSSAGARCPGPALVIPSLDIFSRPSMAMKFEGFTRP